MPFEHPNPQVQAFGRRVEAEFSDEASGHDWWHVWRVWRLARRIAAAEGAEVRTCELAALGHDVEDHKLGRPAGTLAAWLAEAGVDEATAARVVAIAQRVSFKGAGVPDAMPTLEGRVVQDADRLDAIGAVGIARAFAYGGAKGRLLYDPSETPQRHASFEEYKKTNSSSLMHFYEKLFLLKDRLHTPTAQALAEERHAFMEAYVQRFLDEWEGNA
ncbi:HD domain-containing protein [Oceanithermus sp.]|uniref:HD domain-containing protein n=1 Tax=Oceanithermus sp. TaxID=2268145 RepID=UPI00257D86CF|nr:HD domain-containing protein [Oceanithermus sp.]